MPASPTLALTDAQLLDVLHNGSAATVSVVDLDWRFRYVNTGFARALRLPADEVIGQRTLDSFHLPSEIAVRGQQLADDTIPVNE